MENKFTLSHVVLYAKGWYQESNDVWEDLKKVLELDNYTPFTENDILFIIISNFQDAYLGNSNNCLFNVIAGIENNMIIYENNYRLALINYIITSLRFTESKYYTTVVPKYSKELRRPKHITVKSVIDCFNIKKS